MNLSLYKLNPVAAGAGLTVLIYATSQTNAGFSGIFFGLIGGAAVAIGTPYALRASRRGIEKLLDPEPGRASHLLAPIGYRRDRRIESPREAYELSAVRGNTLPNMPYQGVEDEDEPEIEEDDEQEPEQEGRSVRVGSAAGRAVYVSQENEAHIAHHYMALAAEWNPPIEQITGKSMFVCGIRRSGKTNFGALLAEQFAAKDIPFFIPDLEGDYLTLADRRICTRCVLVGSGQNDRLYAHVTREDAERFGETIIKRGFQAILDMQSYGNINEAAAISAAIIRGMIAYTSAHPEMRVPCAVYLDEAQRFLPEQLNASIIKDSAIREELLTAYNDVIAIGGKRGLFPVILTQRISQVKKSIMAQPEIMVLFKQSMDIDLDRYEEFVSKDVAGSGDIKRFAQGQAVVIAPDGDQFVVNFDMRRSEHKGGSPGIETLARLQHGDEGEGEGDDLPESITEVEARRRTTTPTMPMPEAKIPEQSRRAEEIDLRHAILAWNSGENSVRKQAAYFGISEHQARKLVELIKDHAEQQDEQDEQ